MCCIDAFVISLVVRVESGRYRSYAMAEVVLERLRVKVVG